MQTTILVLLITVVAAANGQTSTPATDNFHTLNSSLWTFVNPNGDGTFTVNGTHAIITSPASSPHDLWPGTMSAPRIMQPAANNNFGVVAKFDSIPSAAYQDEGFVLEQDSEVNFLRLSAYSDGTSLHAFAASFAGGNPTVITDTILPGTSSVSLYLKVNRSGTSITYSYSFDGSTYTTVASFSSSLTMNNVGLYAGDSIGAFTESVDYFYNTADTTPPLNETPGQSGGQTLVTDNFHTLNSSLWTFVNPNGDGTFAVNGTHAIITAPASSPHDLWPGTMSAPRIMQAAGNSNFGVVAKFDSIPSAAYQDEGFVLEQDSEVNFLRLSVYSDGASLHGFAASFAGGNPTVITDTILPSTSSVSLYLQVQRSGGSITYSYSFDGSTYTTVASFSSSLTMNNVGLYVGDGIGAFIASVDYFYNTADTTPPLNETPAQSGGGGQTLTTDNFHTLNSSLWTFVNPNGDGTFAVNGTHAIITAPSSSPHDLWPGDMAAPRIMQAAGNSNFGVVAKFDSIPYAPNQDEGFVLEQDSGVNFLRLSVYSDGTSRHAFAASFASGNPTVIADTVISGQTALSLYLQVKRSGTSITYSYSFDGSTYTTVASFSSSLTMNKVGLYAGDSTSTWTASVDYFYNTADTTPPLNETPAATQPVITMWYGDSQTFGKYGQPQEWDNILGNVSDPSGSGIASLTYSLNGGAAQPLSIGPDNFRLVGVGDFNADIDYKNLNTGANTVVFTATGNDGLVTTHTVTVNKIVNPSPPASYTLSWTGTQNVTDVVQVVDGQWAFDPAHPGFIRTMQIGYDRLLGIGDMNTWQNYTVQANMIFHSGDPGGFAFGFVVGWHGHTLDQFGSPLPSQPYIGHPYPGFGGVNTIGSGPSTEEYIGENWAPNYETIEVASPPWPLTPEGDYTIKFTVAKTGSSQSQYSLKIWQAGTTEPANWDLQVTGPLSQGAVLLVAELTDVSWGNVTVQ